MRKAFLVINALLTLSLIAQLYLAALGVFSEPEDELFQFHGTNGRIVLPILVILWIVFGFIARIGRKNIGLTFLGLLLLALQTGVLHHRRGDGGHAAAQPDDAGSDALRPGAARTRRHAVAAAHGLGVLPGEEDGPDHAVVVAPASVGGAERVSDGPHRLTSSSERRLRCP